MASDRPSPSPRTGNLGDSLPAGTMTDELIETLAGKEGVRIERIVSTGHTTPDGEWYDQDGDEWVMVTSGAARLRIEGENEGRMLGAGDWILLPAHCRHRVTWTQSDPPTVWLAVHF